MGELFFRNPDIEKNAFPNWRRSIYPGDEFATYASMFKNSGDKLIESIGGNYNKEADEVINPVLYLYRHSVELILKAILITDYLLKDMEFEKIIDKLNGHDLRVLWNKADTVIREYLTEDIKKDKKPMDFMRKAIMELHDLDEKSFIFRYPYDTKLNLHKVGDGEAHYAFDYQLFRDRFNKVYKYLEGCYNAVFNAYENQEVIPVIR